MDERRTGESLTDQPYTPDQPYTIHQDVDTIGGDAGEAADHRQVRRAVVGRSELRDGEADGRRTRGLGGLARRGSALRRHQLGG